VADDVGKLLRYIGRHYLARQEAIGIELDATAADEAGEIVASQRRAAREEEQRADTLAAAFREGLRRADSARRAGGNAISLDDRKPDQDRQAEALIQFLVRAGLATSTSRETDARHYIYTISVDWTALDRVAREARVDLRDILGRAG
jgi:hypothetical protein